MKSIINQWKQWQTLFSWAPKSLQMMTAAMKLKDTCSVGKSYDKLSVLKSRDITLLTKVYIIKAMVSPEVMYGCECYIIKKAEHWGTDAFEVWCWGRLLRVPWTTRRSNRSILKEINPEYSMEGLRLKLKLQYSGPWYKKPIHWKRPWSWEWLKKKGEEGSRGWDG